MWYGQHHTMHQRYLCLLLLVSLCVQANVIFPSIEELFEALPDDFLASSGKPLPGDVRVPPVPPVQPVQPVDVPDVSTTQPPIKQAGIYHENTKTD
jgi:hypothetical protein